MNPAEQLQAAIDKLTDQMDDSTSGQWVAWKQRRPGANPRHGIEVDLTDVVWATREADIALVETLHATIEPQLTILTKALADEEKAAKHTWFNAGQLTRAGLLLARAINGGA